MASFVLTRWRDRCEDGQRASWTDARVQGLAKALQLAKPYPDAGPLLGNEATALEQVLLLWAKRYVAWKSPREEAMLLAVAWLREEVARGE